MDEKSREGISSCVCSNEKKARMQRFANPFWPVFNWIQYEDRIFNNWTDELIINLMTETHEVKDSGYLNILKGCACQSERSKFIVAEIWAFENKSERDAPTEWMIASAVRQRFLFRSLPLVLLSLLSVQEEIDRRSFLLPVRAGHSGKHHVRHECPTEEPW